MATWKAKLASVVLLGLAAAGAAASCSGGAAECGDGSCDTGEGETAESCAVDCGAPRCGNGTCDAGECDTCAADCKATECEECGNGACVGALEDCKSCPSDCGSCSACGTSTLGEPQPVGLKAECEILDPSHCLLPFPSDWFTTVDSTMPTGRRLSFPTTAMPTNNAGLPAAPADLANSDGFSPGSVLVLRLPGVSLEKSNAPLVTSMQRSLELDSPVVVIDAETGERQLVWAEYDAQATSPDTQAIFVRPGKNYAEGRRYIVAFRNLRDLQGGQVEPNDAFRAYRDCFPTQTPGVEGRREHMEDVLTTLASHGIKRGELTLAWDFTVGSKETLSRRMLHLRDAGFAKLPGTAIPTYKIKSVEEAPVESKFIARIVRGTYQVPSFITAAQIPSVGGRFMLDSNGLPTEQPYVFDATFTCVIPRSAIESGKVTPGLAALYGHQVLATQNEILNSNVQKLAFEHNVTFCATDWTGMSEADALSILTILADISNFPALSDRVQQAMLNFMYLGRLMQSPVGFTADPAFRGGAALQPLYDPTSLAYLGEGQGGTIGGALLAVSKEIKRGVFNVSGMNYTTILSRSVDFAPYQGLLNGFYPNELDRAVLFPLMQILWDRAEMSGYAQHLTGDTYDAETPPKTILFHEAFGDHVLPNITTEWAARTVGAKIYSPPIERGRSLDRVPFFGLELATMPHAGSTLVVWDNGSVPAPPISVPPTEGIDPHGAPGETLAARKQIAQFFRTGEVTDVCASSPCRTD